MLLHIIHYIFYFLIVYLCFLALLTRALHLGKVHLD